MFHLARIDNQEDIILKQETPQIIFCIYRNKPEDIKQSSDETLKIF